MIKAAYIRVFIILLYIMATGNVCAQQAKQSTDTTLNGAVIQVIQAYKPKVKQAPKPEWIPQLPPPDTTRLPIVYQVPQQTLYYSYTSEPLHPLALGKDSLFVPAANYLKMGIGNISTLFLDAGIGGLHIMKDDEEMIHLHHISQQGGIKFQQTALTGAEIDDYLHKPRNDWHAGLYIERNQYYNYGYDHSKYDFARDSIQQTYYSEKLVADMKNKSDVTSSFDYNPRLTLSSYNDAKPYNPNEKSVELSAPISYEINELVKAQMTIIANYTEFKYKKLVSQDNSILEILPGVNYHKGLVDAHAWLGMGWGRGTAYFLPDLLATYILQGTSATIGGGLQNTLRQNTFEQLTTENPFLFNYYQVRQMTKTELYLCLNGNWGTHIFYAARGSWWSYNNLPTYLNDTLDQKQFYVLYDNVTAASLQASARYVVDKTWSAGITGDFYKYYEGTLQYVWSQPAIKVKGDFAINPVPELFISAYATLASGMYGIDNTNKVKLIDAIYDVGTYGEYCFKPNLSAFLQLNNVLNNKYTYFYGYSAYGFNAYAGIRLKF